MEPPIYNPTIPYSGLISGGFGPGRMVRIKGATSLNAKRFSINFVTGSNSRDDDIGLHLSFRFNENCVVRNAQINCQWGPEERGGQTYLERGQQFEILVLCELHQYKIAINGHHFTNFELRIPLERVRYLDIDGEVSVSLIQFEGSNFVPPMHPVAGVNAGPSIGWTAPLPPVGHYQPQMIPQGPYNSGYHPQMVPQGGYSQGPQTGGYNSGYQPQGPYNSDYTTQGYGQHPYQGQGGQSQESQKGKGLLDNAGKLLEKVGLGNVANKIPGVGGHTGQSQGMYREPNGETGSGDGNDKIKDNLVKMGVPAALAGYVQKIRH